MIIREAVKADMPRIAAINIARVPEGTRAIWGVDLTAKFYECYFLEGGPFVVAEENGSLVGYVMGCYRGTTARMKFDRARGVVPEADGKYCEHRFPATEYDCVLLSLAILPEYEGHGVGKCLASAFLEFVRSSGKAANCCVMTQTKNIPGKHTYQACGYTKILQDGESVWYGINFSGNYPGGREDRRSWEAEKL